MQLSSVYLPGLVEAGAMVTVQLGSHGDAPLGSASGSISSVPLIESVYHLLDFLLSAGRRGSSSLRSVGGGWLQYCTWLC